MLNDSQFCPQKPSLLVSISLWQGLTVTELVLLVPACLFCNGLLICALRQKGAVHPNVSLYLTHSAIASLASSISVCIRLLYHTFALFVDPKARFPISYKLCVFMEFPVILSVQALLFILLLIPSERLYACYRKKFAETTKSRSEEPHV